MNLRSLLVGLGVVGVLAVLAVLLSSGSHGYEIRANLADADGLLTGSRVEVGGIGVGSVKSLKITARDHALVTFSVNPKDAPIGRNASVVIRPANLLGEKYIDLSLGNRSEPAHSGFTIPTARTQEATDFDQVIDVLAPTERDRLAVLVHETGVALFGRGVDVAQLIAAMPPSLSDAKSLIRQATASNAQLKGLIGHADGVIATLVAHQTALTHFVSTASGALSATAAHADGLARSVAEAPALLTQLDTSLRSLDVAGAKLRPAASGLEHTAPALTETLTELPGFTRAALPTLAEVKSISPQLVSLGHQAAPVIARLEPAVKKLQAVAGASEPVTKSLDDGIDNLLGTLQNWSRAIQYADGASHEFRVSVVVSPDLINQLKPLILGTAKHSATSQPAKSQAGTGSSTKPGAVSGVGTTTSQLSQSLANATHHLGAGVTSAVNRVVSGISGTLKHVTSKLGHTRTTASGSSTTSSSGSSLSSLLGYLMGGSR